jgi:hypothetical protein
MRDGKNQPPSIEALERRIHALERRRAERLVTVGGLLAVLVLTAGAAALVPDTLAAKSFRLVDAAGAERAALVATDSGAVALGVYDAKGAVAAELVLAPTEPFVSVVDARGERVGVTPPPPPAAESKPSAAPKVPAAAEKDDSFDWLN